MRPTLKDCPQQPQATEDSDPEMSRKDSDLCVPDWRAGGCFLHVAVSAGGEDTALGGIYQAFPCHKRSFQNNLSAAETALVSKNINSYELLNRGVFCPVPGRTPWTFKQAKLYCVLSTLLMVSPAHKRSPRNKTDLLNGFNIHLLGKGLLDRRPFLASPSLSLCFLYLEDTFQVPPDVWVLLRPYLFQQPHGFCLPSHLKSRNPTPAPPE